MSHLLKTHFESPAAISVAGVALAGVGVGLCGLSTYFAIGKIKDAKERRRLRLLIQQKQKERKEAIDKLRRTYELNHERQTIIDLPVDQLLEKLQSRELKATQVLEAYVAKAIQATDAFNCVTDFVPQAFTWARELDQSPEPVGSLHGLPVGIKEDTDIEGMDSTLGLASNLYKPAAKSSVFVLSMRRLGAVPFCKLNVPQTLMSWGSDNPIFGTTLNPLNPKLGPGGSSSGTGCIVAAGAAPVAQGTDVGGSVRLPAHCCGIATIRPTINRLSGRGVTQAVPNLMAITGVPSVLARKAETVATVYKGLLGNYLQNELDPLASPVPWREEIFASSHRLRIGYFTSVPLFPAMGDTESVVLSAKAALESLGHTLVPFQLPDSYNYSMVLNDLYLADDGKYLMSQVEHEEETKSMGPTVAGMRMSHCMRKVMGFLHGRSWLPFLHSKRAQLFSVGGINVQQSWQLLETYGKRRRVIDEVVEQMERERLDLILGPVYPFPALPPDCAGKLLGIAFAYTALWNLVDFPAGVVQFGKESGRKLDQFDNEGDVVLKLAQQAVKESVGMPIGVTLVGKPFQEELVLRAMVELESKKPTK